MSKISHTFRVLHRAFAAVMQFCPSPGLACQPNYLFTDFFLSNLRFDFHMQLRAAKKLHAACAAFAQALYLLWSAEEFQLNSMGIYFIWSAGPEQSQKKRG
jgi:hypothetical protein